MFTISVLIYWLSLTSHAKDSTLLLLKYYLTITNVLS